MDGISSYVELQGLPRNGERCEAGGGWEDVKVALPVVRGLHGSRTEGTTRRFKVGDFKTELNGLGVLRTDIRTVPGRRRGDRIGERMSASAPQADILPRVFDVSNVP